MAYISAEGNYYEGDRAHALDIEVPTRPSPEHVWKNDVWFIDPKVGNNKPIDAEIAALEAAAPISHRTLRDVFLAMAEENRIQRAQIEALVNVIRGSNPALAGFDVERVPELAKGDGMKRVRALDDAIRALRAQRLP